MYTYIYIYMLKRPGPEGPLAEAPRGLRGPDARGEGRRYIYIYIYIYIYSFL